MSVIMIFHIVENLSAGITKYFTTYEMANCSNLARTKMNRQISTIAHLQNVVDDLNFIFVSIGNVNFKWTLLRYLNSSSVLYLLYSEKVMNASSWLKSRWLWIGKTKRYKNRDHGACSYIQPYFGPSAMHFYHAGNGTWTILDQRRIGSSKAQCEIWHSVRLS